MPENNDCSRTSIEASQVRCSTELSLSEMETEIPFHYNKGQGTGESLAPEAEREQEPDLPASVDASPQKVTASAAPPLQQAAEYVVIPTVPDLPFLDKSVKENLEQLVEKMKIQKRHGLQMTLPDVYQDPEFLSFQRQRGRRGIR